MSFTVQSCRGTVKTCLYTQKNQMLSLYWSESVYNQLTIQPQQYLVLGQIKQNYLVVKINLLNPPSPEQLTHISNVKRWEEQDKVT